MTRSEINAIIAEAEQFLAAHRFVLPPFASWTPADIRSRRGALRELIDCRLGWDVTDFGSGDFADIGLTLFTLRNGVPGRHGKPYCEKVLIVGEHQTTPLHTHRLKMEDIINRGGGRLMIRLFNLGAHGGRRSDPVTVHIDAQSRMVEAGGVVALEPGESITLVPGCLHEFWAEDGRVLAGEVSTVNDDEADNVFYDRVGRFPVIEEDAAPYRLLVGDYAGL